jgi:hypothetical protein
MSGCVVRIVRLGVIAVAVLAAIVPLPSRLVEAWYSRGLYPAIQATVTPLTNRVPVALADVASLVLLATLVLVFRARARRGGFVSILASAFMSLLTLAAVLYLAFLALWGLNYRRVPLDQKIEYDAQRITHDAALKLAENAVRTVNDTYERAYAGAAEEPSLESAFAAASRILANPREAVPGVPKRSLLELYFRMAAIDGMTDPFFLEIILNPDVQDFERPFVTAHEWAHLAGYANEAEANLVGWLTCLQGNAMARYSGWLAIYEHVAGSLPRSDRVALARSLQPGPRYDLELMAARYARSTPIVREAARDVYDSYLRANRVKEGIASYTDVVRLILGAGMEEGKNPRPRAPSTEPRAPLH